MKDLHRLLFELANQERIEILFALKNQRLRMSHLSEKLDQTITETARHLQRLSEDKLVRKNPDGLYGLTSFGALVLNLLPPLRFVSKHREYFLDYDVTNIPYEFIDRIGEVEEAVYVPETLKNLEEGENKILEAQEYVWILSNQILTSSIPALAEKLKKPFDLRIILPEGMFPVENKSRLPSKILSVKKRVLPKVELVVVMTEKYAVFCPPSRKGKIDYTGFSGEDPKFHKWCKDLFLHYWEKAKPITPE
jgi:predicted transcriptional regulator